MIQSQTRFATGGVGVNPPQTSLQSVGWESISCETVLQKGKFFIQKRTFFIQIIDSELTGCKTVSQRIDPDPAGCKMDLGRSVPWRCVATCICLCMIGVLFCDVLYCVVLSLL